MLMGSSIDASLIPSTGLVSAPFRAPEYSKCQVVVAPLGIGEDRVKRTLLLLVRRSNWSGLPWGSVALVICRPLFNSKVGLISTSRAVKVTSAVAERRFTDGSRSALIT